MKGSVTALLLSGSLLVIFFITMEKHSSITLRTQPDDIVAKDATALNVHSTCSTEVVQSNPKLSLQTTVNLKTELFIKTGRAGVSVCPRLEVMNSSKINKLGVYPREKRHLTIGISSITRPLKANYLSRTVKLLIENLSEKDRKEVYLVIFLADFDEALKTGRLKEFLTLFKTFIDDNLLHVIAAPREYYPALSNMKRKFDDSQDRIMWRSKLVIDFSFLMCYCKDFSPYYLHLEDDLIPAPSFYPKLQDFIASQKNPWPILDAASMGHTAKIYHSTDLENLASFFFLMYDEMPGDWLIEFWRKIKYDRKYFKDFVLPHASFFQHIGDKSSFKDNKNSYKSKEQFFDAYDVKYRGLNPQATISSSFVSSDGSDPQSAYTKGTGHFWAKQPKRDDFILIKFTSVTTVREVFVDTGSFNAPKDRLRSGVLQASFQNAQCKDFETIGHFKDGRLKISLTQSRKVHCLRILVIGGQSEWIFFREIDVLQS